ncbi:MAG: hypothetical protein Kow00127_11420 [Bacteroidales bacterium]
MMKSWFTILISLTMMPLVMTAQTSDSLGFRNTIKINITNPLILSSRYNVLSWERKLSSYQSFSVEAGRFGMPKFGLINSDSISSEYSGKEFGLHFEAEYRFYLQKENRYTAPRGVYLAPFVSYNYMNRENDWRIEKQAVSGHLASDLSISVFTAGAEVGYQFVFWDRLAVDLIMIGPGIGFYKAKLNLSGDLSLSDDLIDAINNAIDDKWLGAGNAINWPEFTSEGSFRTTGVGFRYLVQVGYRF